MTKAPADAATKVAWDAEAILAKLRARPAFEFTVGELIWLVNLSLHAPFQVGPEFEAEATRLLEKASEKGGEDACT